MDDLLKIPEILGYRKMERLKNYCTTNLNHFEQILRSSIKDPTCLLVFPSLLIEISQYGSSLTKYFDRSDTRPSHPLLMHSDLTEKYLRYLFTGIELIIYKLCHIAIENHSPSYHFESSKTISRLNKLRGILEIDDWRSFRTRFDEVFFIRDAFAHSFVKIEDIRYCGVPLKQCFGYRYASGGISTKNCQAENIFMSDVTLILEPIHTAFAKVQLSQFDKDKLFKLCDHALKTRSMIGP